MTSRISGPLVCPVIVERGAELEAIERCLEQAGGGRGCIVGISGEAGIGKSRLAQEAVSRAAQLGWLALVGRCTEEGRALVFAPLVDLLRSFVASRAPGDVAWALDAGAAELTKLLPEISSPVPGVTPAPSLDPPQERQRLFHALNQLFARLCRSQPLLLLFEDIHWSDDATLDFLLHLARNIATQPMVVLVTYRTDERVPRLGHFLASLDRERLTTEVTLGPLSRAGLASMVRALFSLDRLAPTAFLDRLYSLSEGNPFFIEEVLKVLVMQGELPLDAATWDDRLLETVPIPRSVRDTVERRVTRLSLVVRDILQLAAVIGRRFDFSLLQEVAQVDEAVMIEGLRELISAQLVVEESAERFAFRHSLTREAIYSGILKHERRQLHRRVARAMERIYGDDLVEHAADLAHHFYQAGVWDKVMEYAQRLGERAQALYTPRTAIECFTRALEAARHLGRAEPAALYRSRGQAYEAAGEFERARLDFERALAAARSAGDAAAEWQGIVDLGFLWCARDYDRAGDYFRSALDLAGRLDSPAILAHSLNRLGNWHMNREEMAEARRLHEKALAIFRDTGDRRGTAETLDLLGMTAGVSGDGVAGASYYREAAVLYRELDDRQGLISALATFTAAGGSYETDTIVPGMTSAEAVRAGEQAIRLARELGWRSGEAYALLMLAFCLGPLGDYARAFQMGQAASAVAEEIGHQQWLSGAHAALGALCLDVLAAPRARDHLERALTLATEVRSVIWARQAAAPLASTLLVQGDVAAAESLLERFLSPNTPSEAVQQRLMWCTKAELHLARGEGEQALGIIERLLATAHNLEGRGQGAIPRLAKLRGDALALLHRPEEAEAALLSARAVAESRGLRPLLWRIDASLGKLYRALRRYDQAEQALAAARATIDSLAAELPDRPLREGFLERAAALLPPARPPSPRRAAKEAFGGLTARERDVAALIAQGKTNREIAQHLIVGEVTVATHVGHILAKLGFTSRAQIAAWAVEKGLVSPS